MPALDLAQKALAPLALSLFAFFPPQAPEPAADAAQGPPELSGRYRLNPAESEDPPPLAAEGREARRPPPGARDRGRRPGGDAGRVDPGLRAALEGAPGISVTHTRNEIAVLEQDGRLRILHPDGRAYKSEGGTAEVQARWDGAQLVVETKTERGPRVTETWSLDSGAGKLTIRVTLDGPRGNVSFKRVYDREAAES